MKSMLTKINIKDVPFTSKEYLITSHSSRYDFIGCKTYALALLRILLSPFGQIVVNNNLSDSTLLYHGGKKTSKELEFFSRLEGRLVAMTDRVFDKEKSFKRCSSIVYLTRSQFLKNLYGLIILNEVPLGFRFLLISDLFWNYGYYEYLRRMRVVNVISFFSTTTMAFVLKKVCEENGGKFVYYTWGSNLHTQEFLYSGADLTLMKNSHDENVFNTENYKNKYLVGDVLFSKNKTHDVYLRDHPRVLIIDSCYSEGFQYEEKEFVYKAIADSLSAVNPLFSVRPHPATKEQDLKAVFDNLGLDVVVLSNADALEHQIKEFDVACNLNSTLGDLLIYNGFPVLSYERFMPLGDLKVFNDKYPSVVVEEGLKFQANDCIYMASRYKNYIEQVGVVPIDEALIKELLL